MNKLLLRRPQKSIRFLLASCFFFVAQIPEAAEVTSSIISSGNKDEDQSPDWRLGIGFGAISYPHYLGADQRDFLALPFPYFEYYGKRLSYDDDGLVAKLFSSDRINLNVSMSSTLPVNGEDNDARKGVRNEAGEVLVEDMDDLDLILEAGPSLEITLNSWESAVLRLDIPVRAATEIDFKTSPKFAGWTLDPKLYLKIQKERLRYELEAGALFGSEKYQRIYYEVGSEFATADRPEYQAESGMMGWRFSIGAKYEQDQFRYFGYIRHFNLEPAANSESPLLVDENYWSAGIGMAWMFRSSAPKQTSN